MRNICYICLVALSVLLTGCFGSPASVPEDRFYTLKINKPDNVATKYKNIAIEKVRAYGLYNERAMLYAKSELPLQIKRYHYHHWVIPPTKMIQQGLKEYLDESQVASNVTSNSISRNTGLRVSVELLAFERVISKSKQMVRVKLEFNVIDAIGKQKTYQYYESVATDKNTLHAAAKAYGIALSNVFKKLLKDL